MRKEGFTLVEILIYIAIFLSVSVFLFNILNTTVNVQTRQSAVNELNQQISFVTNTIERLVRNSSLIENQAGVTTTSLILRMPFSDKDPTKIFTDTNNNAIYIQEGSKEPLAITNSRVRVGSFQVTKYENPGGRAVVQVYVSLVYNSDNPRLQFSKDVRTAISRVSAANFDSSLIPLGSGLNIGSTVNTWSNAYFSGAVGIGTTNLPSGIKLGVSGGNIAIYDAGSGLILKTPDGNSCYRIGVTNTGVVTSTVVACP